MKKHLRLPFLLTIGLFLLLSACTNKKLDIDVRQRGCGDFTIYSPSYEVLSDPSCTGSPLVASFLVTFYYSGNDACLRRIVIDSETEVNNGKGYAIDSVAYAIEFPDTSPLVQIDRSANKITFQFDITFQDAVDANNFNDAYIVFHCESLEGDATKSAKLRFFGECSVPPVDVKGPVSTINVRNDEIKVKLWDNASQDGDIVSIYLNGTWVLSQYTLKTSGETFTWPIIQGQNNDLILVANNEGSSGPNTCSISINGRGEMSLNLDLKTGAMIRVL
jgi:hypothetical protein